MREPARITLEAPGEETQTWELPVGAYAVICSPERFVVSEEVDERTGEAIVFIGVHGVTEA